MPQQFVLTYFNIPGRAEATRLAFVIGSIDFDDNRIEGADWPALKPNTPLGHLPMLEITEEDGSKETYVQSNALLRYVGRLAGLYPTDPKKQLRVDEVLETIADVFGKIPHGQKDEEEKKKERQAFQEGKMTEAGKHLDKRMASGYSDGEQLSIADLAVFSATKTLQSGFYDHLDGDFFSRFPNVAKTVANVESHPKVAEYYAKQAAN